MKKAVLHFVCISIILHILSHQVFGSTSIIVGKKASEDGSILFGHNQDYPGKFVVNVWVVPRLNHKADSTVKLLSGGNIPQVPVTWGYIWFQLNGKEFSDCMLNEMGVAIATNRCPSREDKPDLTDGGIGFMLQRLIAERATTAREGVEIGGFFLNKFGYKDSGRSLVLCDANEAWILSIIQGKHWVAQRVPDDGFVVIANNYVIREIDFKDTINFIFSENDILEYATKRGWFDKTKEKTFDFVGVYEHSSNRLSNTFEKEFNLRQWRGQQLLGKNPLDEKTVQQKGLPFSLKSKRKIGLTELMAVLRDHNQGTQYELAKDIRLVINSTSIQESSPTALPKEIFGNPNNTTQQTICSINTQFSFIVQLRSWLPADIGSLLWICFGRPDCNLYIPWYVGINQIPDHYTYNSGITNPQEAMKKHFDLNPEIYVYDPKAAFWIFNELENLVDYNYNEAIGVVQPQWKAFEEKIFHFQKDFEVSALQLIEQNPAETRTFLTRFTEKITEEALWETKKLIIKLKTQLYH